MISGLDEVVVIVRQYVDGQPCCRDVNGEVTRYLQQVFYCLCSDLGIE